MTITSLNSAHAEIFAELDKLQDDTAQAMRDRIQALTTSTKDRDGDVWKSRGASAVIGLTLSAAASGGGTKLKRNYNVASIWSAAYTQAYLEIVARRQIEVSAKSHGKIKMATKGVSRGQLASLGKVGTNKAEFEAAKERLKNGEAYDPAVLQ